MLAVSVLAGHIARLASLAVPARGPAGPQAECIAPHEVGVAVTLALHRRRAEAGRRVLASGLVVLCKDSQGQR